MNNATAAQENHSAMVDPRAGKYLTFFLSDEEYGVEILKVQEIIGRMPITPVPLTSKYIRGVINLRGKIHPIMDLNVKFGMNQTEITDETGIIVIKTASLMMGIHGGQGLGGGEHGFRGYCRHSVFRVGRRY